MPVQFPLPGLVQPSEPLPVAPRAATLRNYPNVPAEALCAHAKAIGRSGELFVDSLLTRMGETVLQLPDDLPADRLLLRAEGNVALQVKTTTHPTGGVYRFEMRKGYRGTPQGVRLYEATDYDLAALVALPENAVRFVAVQAQAHRVAMAEIAGLRADPRASLDEALAALGHGDLSGGTVAHQP